MTDSNLIVKSQRHGKNFESSERKKEKSYTMKPMRLLVDFSTETFQNRRECDDTFKIL